MGVQYSHLLLERSCHENVSPCSDSDQPQCATENGNFLEALVMAYYQDQEVAISKIRCASNQTMHLRRYFHDIHDGLD